jgi:hypothetical protein
MFLLQAKAGLYSELIERIYDGGDALAFKAARLLVELYLSCLGNLFYTDDDA